MILSTFMRLNLSKFESLTEKKYVKLGQLK